MKRLFFSALAIGVLAVTVILLMNQTIDALFGLAVAVCYTIVAIGFVNYRSRAAFVVRAMIEPSEREQARPMVTASTEPSECEPARPMVEAVGLPEEPVTEQPNPDVSFALDADSLSPVRETIDAWVAAKHYLEPDVTVEEIALQMGISRQTLNDYFSTVLQTPFRSWRIELRIREAERLLAVNPAIPTGELCTRCGYNDRSNFHKHFAKATGRSLAEYRDSVQRG